MNFKEFFLGEERRKTGLYVSAVFNDATNDNLFSWAEKQNIPGNIEILPKKNYHTTILYSRKDLPKEEWINAFVTHRCIPKKFTVFPYDKNSKCIVLELIAPTLQTIHKELVNAGGTHDYPDYIPHVTLFRSDDKELDISGLELPKFELYTDRIKSEHLDLNWASK